MAATDRINLRLTPNDKTAVEKAAAIKGKNVNRYIVDEITRVSEETIDKHETIKLGREDSERFLRNLASPSPFNDKLKEAMRLHGKTVTVK